MGSNTSNTSNVPKLLERGKGKQNVNSKADNKVACNKLKVTNKTKYLKVGSWNIKRGFHAKETEIVHIIKENKLNILGLQEVDMIIDTECAPCISNHVTVLPILVNKKDKTRVMMLVNKAISFKLRADLMSTKFQSIWIETEKMLICTFYREWSKNELDNNQMTNIEIFSEQMRSASKLKKEILVMGDMNLCSNQWNTRNYKHKKISDVVKATLAECGYTHVDLGITYIADHPSRDGNIAKSALDHAYVITKKQNYV